MIAISSHRPHTDAKYAFNQMMAGLSWRNYFESIYYFGQVEDDLNDPLVHWVPSEEWPSIRTMATFASKLKSEYVAILNADIVIGPEFRDVMRDMTDNTLPAATSYRWEFDGDMDQAVRHKEDRGMDIFITRPDIWGMIALEIPPDLRIGHNRWDSWVCGFFNTHLGFGFRGFTEKKCIFHPKHEGRNQPFTPSIKSESRYFTMAKRPSPMYPILHEQAGFDSP